MTAILFVCTGNQFRSPLAEAFFARKLAVQQWRSEWLVGSAGTWTLPGLPALPVASAVAHQLGISLAGHRTQTVSQDLLAGYDLILVMEASHKEALEQEFPTFRDRMFLLLEVVDAKKQDIPDPMESEDAVYKAVGLEIRDVIERGYYKICIQALRLSSIRSISVDA